MADSEVAELGCRLLLGHVDGLDSCPRRALLRPRDQPIDRSRPALCDDFDVAVRQVLDVSAQSEFGRLPLRRPAEADALDHPADDEMNAPSHDVGTDSGGAIESGSGPSIVRPGRNTG